MPDFNDGRMVDALAKRAFDPLDHVRSGVALRTDVEFDELMALFVNAGELARGLHLEHDGAGAPFLVDSSGEESRVFISLTDEDDVRGIAWIEPETGSGIVGVGIDLAARGDFPFKESMMGAYRRIFTERELEVIYALAPDDPDLGATLVFSAKEAVFKSASQQIRAEFHRCGDDPAAFGCPYFETRDIEVLPCGEPEALQCGESRSEIALVDGLWNANGIAHIGDAAAAFRFLQIGHVHVRYALVENMVLTVAVAMRS